MARFADPAALDELDDRFPVEALAAPFPPAPTGPEPRDDVALDPVVVDVEPERPVEVDDAAPALPVDE